MYYVHSRYSPVLNTVQYKTTPHSPYCTYACIDTVSCTLTEGYVGHLLAGIKKCVFRTLGEDVLQCADHHGQHQRRRA